MCKFTRANGSTNFVQLIMVPVKFQTVDCQHVFPTWITSSQARCRAACRKYLEKVVIVFFSLQIFFISFWSETCFLTFNTKTVLCHFGWKIYCLHCKRIPIELQIWYWDKNENMFFFYTVCVQLCLSYSQTHHLLFESNWFRMKLNENTTHITTTFNLFCLLTQREHANAVFVASIFFRCLYATMHRYSVFFCMNFNFKIFVISCLSTLKKKLKCYRAFAVRFVCLLLSNL